MDPNSRLQENIKGWKIFLLDYLPILAVPRLCRPLSLVFHKFK